MARLIEPKGGLETLGNALGLMYVKSEELVEKNHGRRPMVHTRSA